MTPNLAGIEAVEFPPVISKLTEFYRWWDDNNESAVRMGQTGFNNVVGAILETYRYEPDDSELQEVARATRLITLDADGNAYSFGLVDLLRNNFSGNVPTNEFIHQLAEDQAKKVVSEMKTNGEHTYDETTIKYNYRKQFQKLNKLAGFIADDLRSHVDKVTN